MADKCRQRYLTPHLCLRLSFEEFMGEETKAEKLFKLMDKDGDGYVTKAVSDFLNSAASLQKRFFCQQIDFYMKLFICL